MPKLASYYLPGLYIEDHAVDVPLDWRGHEPAQLAADGLPAAERIQLFYRTVCTPENVGRDLPLLVFLQGGPGGAGPRPLSPTSDGWIEEATKHFRVVLPDQRGTGRSSHVSRHALEAHGDARSQAEFLKRFLAPSIVRDFEYLRLTEFAGRSWTTLGQSYGGWLTLTYLSFYPAGIAASLTCGAIPHLPASADEVYAHTFPRMAAKTRAYYERYPEDAERVAAVADRLAAGDVRLPDGSPLTPRRLQQLGQGLGMKPAPERLHNLFDTAFEAGAGTLAAAGAKPQLTDGFLMGALQSLTTAGDPLYWVLQELIYADGTLEQPIRWSAAREYASRPEFSADARPLMLVGLEGKEGSYPSQLSGGQQQRVAIARALMTSPKTLLCDEATSALDTLTTSSVLDLLARINRELGVTIVLITHSLAVARRICGRIAVMEHGHVEEQGTVAEVFGNPKAEVTRALLSFEGEGAKKAGAPAANTAPTANDEPVATTPVTAPITAEPAKEVR